MTAEQRLAEMGLELPQPPAAVASYEPWVRSGNMVFTSVVGQFQSVVRKTS